MAELTQAQLHVLDERLAERETELQARVREAKERAADRSGEQAPQGEDLVEEGEERFRTGIEHVELVRDQEELVEIADARGRIALGQYGECIDCGRQIGFDRLNAQPTAKRCIGDQSAYEKKHGTSLRYTT